MVEGGDEMRGQMIDVVATADGLFAFGGVPGADAAGVWRSTDGETWERTAASSIMPSCGRSPRAVRPGGRRLAPRPRAGLGGLDVERRRCLVLAPDPEGYELAEATDVLDLDGTLVMVGSSLTSESRGHIWVSDDGLTWELAVAGGMDGRYARPWPHSAGLVAVGGGPDMSAAAWISTDGHSWQPLGDPEPSAYFQSAVATDDGVLLIGATQTGTLETGIETHAMIWTAEIDWTCPSVGGRRQGMAASRARWEIRYQSISVPSAPTTATLDVNPVGPPTTAMYWPSGDHVGVLQSPVQHSSA